MNTAIVKGDSEEEIPNSPTSSMLSKRIISAAIIILVCALVAYWGEWIFSIFLIGILTISSWEYHQMFIKHQYSPSIFLLMLSPTALCLAQTLFSISSVLAVFITFFIATILFSIVQYERGDKKAVINFAFTISGISFIALLGSFLIALRNMPNGLAWTFLTIPAISAGDIGAYFIGCAFGKHKITPIVSPNKSWEGFIGGTLCTILYSLTYGYLIHPHVPEISVINSMVIGLLLGLTSPISDLFESMIKRFLGEKDSSNLIPGHGGVFDRIDTWLIGGAASYYLVILTLQLGIK